MAINLPKLNYGNPNLSGVLKGATGMTNTAGINGYAAPRSFASNTNTTSGGVPYGPPGRPSGYIPPKPPYAPNGNTASYPINDPNSLVANSQLKQYNSLADQYYNDASGKENAYIDQLKQQSKNRLDIMLKQLDTQHKLALGNGDDNGAKFLESVANSLEQQIGRIPYDYQKYTNQELQGYTQGNQAIGENRTNALAKLQNDEQALGLNQYKTNQDTAESLNQRGLLAGQAPINSATPTGSTYAPLTGLNGLAGQQAGLTNQAFNNQFQGMNIQGQGINNDFNQQQRSLDLNHANTDQNLQDTYRRQAQDENTGYTFNTGMANQDYNDQAAALERQRQQLLEQDRKNSYSQAGIKMGQLGS